MTLTARYPHLQRVIFDYPWAMRLPVLQALAEVVGRRLVQGTRLTPDEIEARVGHPLQAASRSAPRRAGTVAIIPVLGLLAQRAGMVTDVSGPGGTSTEAIARALQAALADPGVTAIAFDVDSPGGSVFGTPELADTIYAARGKKPMAAVANAEAASAAYWIASQADELLVTPSGEVGSIGIYGMHVDESKALEAEGLAVTYVSAGKYKVEGNPSEPLSSEAKAALQGRVDGYYDRFIRDVARGRGAALKAVRTGFGEGRMVGAQAAVDAGMADGVATLEAVVARLARGVRATARVAAADPAVWRERARLLDSA